MLSIGCQKFIDYLIRQNLLPTNQRSWYIYALQSRIATLLSILGVIGASSLFVSPFQTTCFLLGLLPLRRRLGGYHAKTPTRCFFLSIAVMMLCLAAVNFLLRHHCLTIIWITVLALSAMLLISTPYGTPNLHLSASELLACWSKMKRVVCYELALVVLLLIFVPGTSGAVFYSVGIIAAALSFFVCRLEENHE